MWAMRVIPPEHPLPSCGEIRRSIELYLKRAYPGEPPEQVSALSPPQDADSREWLMGGAVEREPRDAPLQDVLSFALRLGNAGYRHMKLRICRPRGEQTYVFLADAHDGVLCAPQGTSYCHQIEVLKGRNREIAADITEAWERAGLPTERTYLRAKLHELERHTDCPAT
jgi:hypothetical protein